MEDYIAKLEERAMDGDADAAMELKDRYLRGDGVQLDFQQADYWYRYALELYDREENAEYEAAAKAEPVPETAIPVFLTAKASSEQPQARAEAPAQQGAPAESSVWKTEAELRCLPYQQQKREQMEENPFAISMFARKYLSSGNPEEQRYGTRQLFRANQLAQAKMGRGDVALRDMVVANDLALGLYYENRTPEEPGDKKTAFELYTDAHELDPSQLENLVRCYMNGIGCERNENTAWSLQEKAAIEGGVKEQYAIAELLRESGQKYRAAEWYHSAVSCEDASTFPAYAAAASYQLTRLEQPDSEAEAEEALRELERLAEGGDASAALLRAEFAADVKEALKFAQIGSTGLPEADARRCKLLAENYAAELRLQYEAEAARIRAQEEAEAARLRAEKEAEAARLREEEAAEELRRRKEQEAAEEAARQQAEEEAAQARARVKKARQKKLIRVFGAVAATAVLIVGGILAFLNSSGHKRQVRQQDALEAAGAAFAQEDYLSAMKTLAEFNDEEADREVRELFEKAGAAYEASVLNQVTVHSSEKDLEKLLSGMQTLQEGMVLLPKNEALTERMDGLIRQFSDTVGEMKVSKTADLLAIHQQFIRAKELWVALPETEAMRQADAAWTGWYLAQTEALTAVNEDDLDSFGPALDELEKICADAPDHEEVLNRRESLRNRYVALTLEAAKIGEGGVSTEQHQQSAELLKQAQKHLPANNAALAERKQALDEAYADWAVAQVNALRTKQQFEDAAALLTTARKELNSEPAALAEAGKALETEYVAWCTAQVKALKESGQYPEASVLAENAKGLFPQNGALKELYASCQPTDLKDIHLIEASGFNYTESEKTYTDSYGNDHTGGNGIIGDSYYQNEWHALYNLNGEYNTLTGYVFVTANSSDEIRRSFIIYDDDSGEVLYDSTEAQGLIYKKTRPFSFQVDVQGVENLRIDSEYRSSDGYLVVDNLTLYR